MISWPEFGMGGLDWARWHMPAGEMSLTRMNARRPAVRIEQGLSWSKVLHCCKDKTRIACKAAPKHFYGNYSPGPPCHFRQDEPHYLERRHQSMPGRL